MPKKKYESMDDVPEGVKQKLSNFFTNIGGNTFVIHGLPPELAGGALARYSRAPTGMQLTIINEFLDEKGDPSQQKGSELMDRVLNAYGDDSVGELEGAHVGIEEISQLLTKTIEDRRIGGSPIEQSTRYVKYDQKTKDGKWRYLRPKEIMGSPLAKKYEDITDKAFDVYSKAIELLIEYFKKQLPEEAFQIDVERDGEKTKASKNQLQNESEQKAFKAAYNFTVRCAALDVARCVLPASTLTHMGLFGNGRFFTNLITALKSSDLMEEQERGLELEKELSKSIPTFIKRNKRDPETVDRAKRMEDTAKSIFSRIQPTTSDVTLVKEYENLNEIISYALYPYTNIPLEQILIQIENLPQEKKVDILKTYIGPRKSRRDRSGRGLEAGYPITFDLLGTFGEYRDLQRHRILTQQRQLLTTEHGFVMPPEIKEVGLEKDVEEVVSMMGELNAEIKSLGLLSASQYATLFNHRMRFIMGMNLREFQHLSELRTQIAGHFGYRAMLMQMARELEKKYPWAKLACGFVDYSDPGNKIARAKEQSRIAGKNLAKGVEGDIDF